MFVQFKDMPFFYYFNKFLNWFTRIFYLIHFLAYMQAAELFSILVKNLTPITDFNWVVGEVTLYWTEMDYMYQKWNLREQRSERPHVKTPNFGPHQHELSGFILVYSRKKMKIQRIMLSRTHTLKQSRMNVDPTYRRR